MAPPTPPVALDGDCSVIYNNTLYAYSSSAFQSLRLEQGAEWKQLPGGQPVQGGVCVGSTPQDPAVAGLYVVGGTSSDSDYQGLQKFTYSSGKWESITPEVPVTQSRRWHSATYLNASGSILIYAGAQDGSDNLSSQTFTVAASSPYTVLAFQSVAPPAVAPILVPWSDTQAVMIGGDPTNTKIMLFDPASSWVESGATLMHPLEKNSTVVKGTIIQGDDGSKHLYTFDATQSPNVVNRTVLLDGTGAPVTKAAPVLQNDESSPEKSTRRALEAGNWPPYNSTFVSTTPRSDYSLATRPDGLVVMSGGDRNDVLCMFDARSNTWNNATARLAGAQIDVASAPTPSEAATTAVSATRTPTPSSTAAAAAPSTSSPLPPASILGIALGSILGTAVILICMLFFLRHIRRKRRHAEAGHSRRASGAPPAEKGPFPDGTAQASGGYFKGHSQQESDGSVSSMAILMGKVQKPAMQRKASVDTQCSSSSNVHNKQFRNAMGRPEPQLVPDTILEPPNEPRDEKPAAVPAAQPVPRNAPEFTRDGSIRRSSGWNRYWSGGSMMNILGYGSSARRETVQSEQSSQYSDTQRMTQDSATVPPLRVEGRPSFSQVHSGSPRLAGYSNHVEDGMMGQLERPPSNTSSSGYSSGIPPSVQDEWDPTRANKPWGSDRAPSSAYSSGQSMLPTGFGFPNNNNNGRPPTGVSRQPQLVKAKTSTDMSWLNLGDNGASTINSNAHPYRL